MIGALDDNFLDLIPDTISESDCIDRCRNNTDCKYYTYFLDDDPNYGTCTLLSSFAEPFEECETCVTGPLECQVIKKKIKKTLDWLDSGGHRHNCKLKPNQTYKCW